MCWPDLLGKSHDLWPFAGLTASHLAQIEPEVMTTGCSNPLFYLVNPILFIWDLKALHSLCHLIHMLSVDKIGKIYPGTSVCNWVYFL